ncbi:MAG: hypothetical protein K2G88_09505 [Oscillospiraceae bacterium]|nr:hypothetical protein [Oscillospiraceae bacterium]
MKKLLYFFVTLVFFCSVAVVPLVAVAENNNSFENYCQSKGIDYMTSHQYQTLMESLIDGSDYNSAYHEATGSYKKARAVDLEKKDKTTDTNFTKPSIFDKIRSVLGLGKEVYETTKDLLKDEVYGEDWDVQIPTAVELIGKTRIIYDSGIQELITLGIAYTRYYDKNVELYRNKCQIYGTRQVIVGGGGASTDFHVSIDGGYYPVSYNSSSMLGYSSASGVGCAWTDLEGEQQFTTTSCTFSTIGLTTSGGGTSNSPDYYLHFVSLNRQGVTYGTSSLYLPDSALYTFNVRSNYRNFTKFPTGTDLNVSSSVCSILYTTSAVSTNDYQSYVNQNQNQQNVYSPSLTFNNSYVGGTKITNNNYNDYGFEYSPTTNTWNTNQTWYNTWENSWNEQVVNNYNNYYTTIDNSGSTYGNTYNQTFNPFKDDEEPTEPTDPPEPTQPDTYPPATLPSEPTETYRIVDFETLDTVSLEVGTLPDVYEFPEVAEVGGLVLQQSTSFLDKLGLLPVYVTLGVLSIAVFIMRGQK